MKWLAIVGLTSALTAIEGPHRGWITGLARCDGRVVSCSQGGVFFGTKRFERASNVAFRVVAVAFGGGRLCLAGGRPGKTGMVASSKQGAVPIERRVADDQVYAIAVDGRGTSVACACADGRALLLDAATLQTKRLLFRHTAPASCVAFSADGHFVASGGLDGLVTLTDLGATQRAPRIFAEHTAAVSCVSFRPDGGVLASGARDGKVRLHATSGRYLRATRDLGAALRALTWSSNGKSLWLALANGAVLELPAAFDQRRVLRAADDTPWFALVRDGDRLLVAGRKLIAIPLARPTDAR